MPPTAPGERTEIKRGSNRAVNNESGIAAILDASFLCHVAFTVEGEARVLPTAFVRIDDAVYLHGHLKNQMLNALLEGQSACLCVTILDGLVLARSGFHHSVNYRSVTLFGKAEQVTDEEKVQVLDALVDHMIPGRPPFLRAHSPQELNATLVVKIPIDEAVAKVRNGPPVDAEKDYETDIWAGVVTIETRLGDIEPCPRLDDTVPVPEHVQALVDQEVLFPNRRSRIASSDRDESEN